MSSLMPRGHISLLSSTQVDTILERRQRVEIRQVLKCLSTPLRYKLSSLYQTRFLIFFQTSHWVGTQGDEHVKFCRKTLLLLHIWIVMSKSATTCMSNIFFHFLLSSHPLRPNANPDFYCSAADYNAHHLSVFQVWEQYSGLHFSDSW